MSVADVDSGTPNNCPEKNIKAMLSILEFHGMRYLSFYSYLLLQVHTHCKHALDKELMRCLKNLHYTY